MKPKVNKVRYEGIGRKKLKDLIQKQTFNFLLAGYLVLSLWVENSQRYQMVNKSPFETTENAHLLLINLIENVYQMGIFCSIKLVQHFSLHTKYPFFYIHFQSNQ